MEKRYRIDELQADRVEATAVEASRAGRIQMGPGGSACRVGAALGGAACTKPGLDIAHSKYHRHSAYLLEHADMPGFPREELAAAVRAGRRSSASVSVKCWRTCCRPGTRLAGFLSVILRLAVLLHRGRSPQPLPEVRLGVKSRNITLELPQRWIKEHPLTLEDLEQERATTSRRPAFRLTIV